MDYSECTRKRLIDGIEEEVPEFFKKFSGVIKQMKRKQLLVLLALIELNKEEEDGTNEGDEGNKE